MKQHGSKARVLVVEDNDDVRRVVTIYLKSHGYAVEEAADGQAGLEKAAGLPDVVLLDVLLPRLDGLEVLRRLRKDAKTARLPVIMMSAVLQTRDLQAETARLRVSSFLQKPFQVKQLISQIEGVVSSDRRAEKKAAPPCKTDRGSGPEDSAGPSPAREPKGVRYQRARLPEFGSLEKLPMPELLHAVYVEERTGVLSIIHGPTQKKIFFENGFSVYAESSLPEETLGAHMLRSGRITTDQNERAIAEMTRSGRRFGEVLLKMDLINPHELFAEMESHLSEKVVSTFGWLTGQFRFAPGDSWREDVIIARMNPGRILLDGIARHWSPERIQKRIPITDRSAVFSLSSSPYPEEQIGLTPREAKIFQLARRGASVREILQQVPETQSVAALLFGLFVMEHVGFVLDPPRDSEIPASTAQEIRSSEPPAAPRDVEPAKGLLAEYLRLRTADYFKLLGVTRNSTEEEIREAFQQRQRRYHPDTLAGIDRGLVHEKIEELYIRVHTAYRTLIDPETRHRYIAKLDREDGPERVSTDARTRPLETLKAQPEHERPFDGGLSALRNGDFDLAARLFSRAEQQDSHPRHTAYRLWAEYLMKPHERRSETERTFHKLQKKHPDEVVFPYLLGKLHLREKNSSRAIKHFEAALEIDPGHIDSARQLRIIRMRQRSSEHSGLFDLFKRR
ncbi:MAG: response regulator [Polyangia bacterium]